MNILLINHYAGSDRYGMEYRPYYFAREWAKQGHNVRIIGATYSHVRRMQPKVAADVTKEICQGFEYYWLKTPQYQGNGVGRIINILVFLWKLWFYSKALIQDFQPDCVIASSTYPLDVFVARRVAKKTGAKFVYEVHDLWPLTPMELGGYSKWNPFIMTLQFAEDYGYKRCDKVVSLLPCAKEYMVSRGLADDKFIHIPNGTDFTDSYIPDPLPDSHLNLLAEYENSGKFLVGWAGTLSLSNKLEVFLEAIEKLKGQPIEFFILGNGAEEQRLKELSRQLTLFNLHFLPAITKAQVPLFLDKMDALYVGFAKQSLYRFGVSPNKLMDYMRAEKPIVYAINSGNRPVDEAECGYSVEAEDAQAIADAILRMSQLTPEQRRNMGSKGGAYVKNHHDYSVLSRNFLDSLS